MMMMRAGPHNVITYRHRSMATSIWSPVAELSSISRGGGVWSKPGCIIASPVRACNYFNSPRDACTTTGSRIFLARRRPNASDSGWKRNCLFAPGSLLIHTGHGDAFQLRRVTQATRVSHHSHGTTKGLLFPPPATENAVVVKRFLQSCAFNCRWRPCCSLSAEQDYLLLKPTYGF